jgi:hypothetical protein
MESKHTICAFNSGMSKRRSRAADIAVCSLLIMDTSWIPISYHKLTIVFTALVAFFELDATVVERETFDWGHVLARAALHRR